MKWRNVIIVAVIVLPIVALFAYGFGRDPREVPSVLGGRAAPACTLQSLDGERVAFAELKGKPLVVNFWATWCVPCEAEHQLLQQAARAVGDRVKFVGVVYEDDPEAARQYLARKGNAYVQLRDAESRCAIDFGVAGVPETFFIDSKGTVVQKHVGPLTEDVLGSLLHSLEAKP